MSDEKMSEARLAELEEEYVDLLRYANEKLAVEERLLLNTSDWKEAAEESIELCREVRRSWREIERLKNLARRALDERHNSAPDCPACELEALLWRTTS